MMKNKIETDKAPKVLGPYNQGISIDNLVFISGQIPLIPATNEVISEDIKLQTKQTLDNIENILKSENLTMNNIVKTTLYIKDMDDFTQINEVYKTFFVEPFPARATVEVSRLPKNVLLEIDAIAIK